MDFTLDGKEPIPCYSGSMSVPEEVVYDFCAKNRQEYPLTNQSDMDPNNFELIGDDEYYDVFDLSRVGFNAERTLAFFQERFSDGCFGSGGPVLMIKENGAWKIQDIGPGWYT